MALSVFFILGNREVQIRHFVEVAFPVKLGAGEQEEKWVRFKHTKSFVYYLRVFNLPDRFPVPQ